MHTLRDRNQKPKNRLAHQAHFAGFSLGRGWGLGTADHERITELRDVQRRHRRFLKTQREKELDQKKDQKKKPDHMSLGIKEKLLSKMKSRDGAEL